MKRWKKPCVVTVEAKKLSEYIRVAAKSIGCRLVDFR